MEEVSSPRVARLSSVARVVRRISSSTAATAENPVSASWVTRVLVSERLRAFLRVSSRDASNSAKKETAS